MAPREEATAPHEEAMAPLGDPLPPQAMSISEAVELAIDKIPTEKWLKLLMDECKVVTRWNRTAVNVSQWAGHFCGVLVGKVAAEIWTVDVIPFEERLDEIIQETVKRRQGFTQMVAAAVASGLSWLAGWCLHQLFLMMWPHYDVGAWTPVVGAVAVAAGTVAAYCSAGETLKMEVAVLLRARLAEQMPYRDPRRSRSSTPQEASFTHTPQAPTCTPTPQATISTPTPQEATPTHKPQEPTSTHTPQEATSTATSQSETSTATPQLAATTLTHTPQAPTSSEKPHVARVYKFHVSNCSVGNINLDGIGSRDSACVYHFHASNSTIISINS